MTPRGCPRNDFGSANARASALGVKTLSHSDAYMTMYVSEFANRDHPVSRNITLFGAMLYDDYSAFAFGYAN